jgi:NifB/MoaA-like Fe-S oxidoreductase
VDQLPPDLRGSLYVKDDDWKMSLLFSNYVTFTNTSDRELDEIVRNRYSPLYVSVHAADPAVRAKLLGLGESGRAAETADVMRVIGKLRAGGIVLHAQIVLCPGLNDGDVLRETIEKLHGKTRSLAVVPVGLTKYQKNPSVKAVTPELAKEIIGIAGAYQEKYLKEGASRFVWCSDEMYQRAGLPIPDFDAYENFPQIGNGVGLLAQFEYEFNAVMRSYGGGGDGAPAGAGEVPSGTPNKAINESVPRGMPVEAAPPEKNKSAPPGENKPAPRETAGEAAPPDKADKRTLSLATGESAHGFLSALCRKAEGILNLKINCYKIVNRFFGESATVAGLVTGGDIAEQLKGKRLGESLLVPSVMLRAEGDLFLDGTPLSGLAAALGVKVEAVDAEGAAFAEKLIEIAGA